MKTELKANEFCISDVPPGSILRVGDLAVFNVDGAFCATQAKCTHKQGPLNEGKLEGSTVTCPWHGTQFDVRTGAVLRGPAKDPLKTYRVLIEGDVAQIDVASPVGEVPSGQSVSPGGSESPRATP